MAGRASVVLKQAVRAAKADEPASDRELLRRFARENDQGAFEALVARHAGMVLGVSRRALPTVQDAEDACQATFLVLANKANSGRWQASVANWLYATARKVAHNARVAAERRAKREAGAAVPEAVEPVDRMTGRELLVALDEELARLPARYREPLVLCYLEGLTRDEAAARIGVPLATLHTRIDRGRKRLHEALTNAGCALGAGLLALAVTSPAGASPPRLVESILAAASGPTSAAVGELARGVAVNGPLRKVVLAVAVAVGVVALGAGLGVGEAANPAPARPIAPEGNATPPPAEAPVADKRVEVKGTVLGPDDKPVPGAKLFLVTWDGLIPAPQPIRAAREDGTFAFAIGEGVVEVVATAPGHGIGWAHLHLRPLPPCTVRLTPEQMIRGKVVNLEGRPVAGVSVSVVGVYQPHEERTLDGWLKTVQEPSGERGYLERFDDRHSQLTAGGMVTTATSDREGKFEIRGLGRDRVAILRVTSPTTATHQVNVITRSVERFLAPGLHTTTADAYHGCDPVLVAAPVSATTGRVIDATTGKPVRGTALWVESLVQGGSSIMGLKAIADADGRFTLPGLPQGNQALSVVVIPPDSAPYHRLRLSVPDDPVERAAFDVKLTRGIPATVKIIDKATGQSVRACLRYGVFPDDNPNQKAVPHVWHNSHWTHAPDVGPSRPEFRIVVFPGKGLVAAQSGWNTEYLTGVGVEAFEKHRHEDQLHGLVSLANIHFHQWHTFAEIDVPADAKEFRFTLALERGLTVAGRLFDTDGMPVVGAESFGLGNAMQANASWAKPAAAATFTAVALRPGEKRRVMFVHTERKLAGSAVVVGGANGPVEVRMERWGVVTGWLVGADGKPVVGSLYLSYDVVRNPDLDLGSSPFSRPGTASALAGPDGRFKVTGLVPGLKYRWIASGPKNTTATVPDVTPKAGQTTDIGDVVVREKQP